MSLVLGSLLVPFLDPARASLQRQRHAKSIARVRVNHRPRPSVVESSVPANWYGNMGARRRMDSSRDDQFRPVRTTLSLSIGTQRLTMH